MMFDKDELYIKFVVLDEIYNFLVQFFFWFEVIWMSKYASKDFIELIPKEFICLSECAVVVKDFRWINNQT